MGLRASFSVTQDLGYPAFTPQLGIPIDYSEGCNAFVSAWEENATDMVPVDTGYLKSTLKASTDGDYCECITTCDYAQYVEYGTIKMGAQPYFEPALHAALAEAKFAWIEAQQEAMIEEQEEIELMKQAEQVTEGNSKSGGGAFGGFGGILGLIIGAIIVGVLNVLMDIVFGGDGSSGSSISTGGAEGLMGGGAADRIDVEII